MRFYVNGAFLAGITDATYYSGNVGLLAEAFEEGDLVVRFDNVRFDNVRLQVLKGF